MRVLIITLGSLGDLLPLVPIARTLRARGHHVSIAANNELEPEVRNFGFDFTSVLDSERVERPREDARFRDLNRTWILGWERYLAPAMRPTYEYIRTEIQHHSCVVVAHWMAFGARLAQEKLGVPLCTMYLAPEPLNSCDMSGSVARRWRNFSEDDVFGPLLNAYRRELELPPVDRICSHWLHSPQRGIALFPDWFWPRQPYWPEQIITSGFVSFDESLTSIELSKIELSKLDAFLDSGAPPVVFTPGTSMSQAAEFFRHSLVACEAIGARALFLTRSPAQLPESLPPWALHIRYLPLHRILGRASAIVYHGGIGTCAQAVRAGVPQLVVPIVFDQFDNAHRVETLRLGVSVPMKDYCAAAIAETLTHLLSSDAIRQSCSSFAARFPADDVSIVNEVCEIVEWLGESRYRDVWSRR